MPSVLAILWVGGQQPGAHVMDWEAEPNAAGFYERMGGRYLRDEISGWGGR